MASSLNLFAGNAFYYYDDLETAYRFYTDRLGFALAADFKYAKIIRIAANSYLTLVDSAFGLHKTDQPKSVTLALVTEQLQAWYEHLKREEVYFEKEIKIEPNSAHDGFVIRDPEGYFLEFERFNPHPENEALMPLLAAVPSTPTTHTSLAIQATVTWLYYDKLEAVQTFYETLLESTLLVDQGWAKVYPVAGSSFIGLVDGEKGLHKATEKKAVMISFLTREIEPWLTHVRRVKGFELRKDEIVEEAGRVRLFVGFDPGGYYLEWDQFLNIPENENLNQ